MQPGQDERTLTVTTSHSSELSLTCQKGKGALKVNRGPPIRQVGH